MCEKPKTLGLNKLNFENIRENQRKVVEPYLSGRDVLMIWPKGSGKSLTFHIAPFAIDFFKHGERDVIQTVCLVIFPLVSSLNDQVSSLRRWKRNQGCCCRSRQFRKWKQGSLRGQIQAPKLCLVVIGPRFPHWRTKSKLYSLMKCIV